MKKVLKALPILLAALVLTVSAAACSPATLEDYFRETSRQDELQAIADSQSGDGVTASYYCEGNTVILEYQVDTSIDSGEANILNEMLEDESYKQTFENFVTEIRDETRVKSVTLKIRYKDINGSIVAEKEYNPA